jgi:outer membrane protein
MRRFCYLPVFFTFAFFVASGREGDNRWTLQQCIGYAIDHNISIKQDSLNARLARYARQQTLLSQLPNISSTVSYGRSFGRSINPTTNQFVEGNYDYLSVSGSANALIFGGLQVRNNLERNKYNLYAALADLEQLKDDVSLNVANAFLAVLLAQEQITVSRNQVGVTSAQLAQTRAFAESGRLPELNVAQLESQQATDSANLINSISTWNSALLDLKALLNLDFNEPFAIEVGEVPLSDVYELTAITPEQVFQQAISHFGAIKGSKYRVNAAEKGLAAARGGMYPQLYLGYQIGSNFASNYLSYKYTPDGYQVIGAAVDTNGVPVYNVVQPSFTTSTTPIPLHNQVDNNLRHSLYLNLNIPILNGWQTQYNIKQARISLESQRLNEYNASLTLKQNVYKAHNNALNAIQKYNAARRANEAAQRALEFARKRYDLGLTSTVDLLVTQNAQFNAASNLAIARYDLIFKLKVIDYYLGKEIKL